MIHQYLLFGGQPDTGKTSTIRRLTTRLTSEVFGFNVIDGTFPPASGNDDFLVLLRRHHEDKDKYIIINSASDDSPSIENLKNFIDKHSVLFVDVLISSVRDINWERSYFFTTLGIGTTDPNIFEIPLARVTRRASSGLFPLSISWYEDTLDRHINFIINNPPFSL